MPGPVPKDPKIRQRRNIVSTRAQLAGDPGTRKNIPSLSRIDAKRKWHSQTLAWWRDIWRSPMAAEFLESDKHALFRLAVLVDEFWHLPTKELAAEIRLEQQAFGLTPIDRRRLQWSVDGGNQDNERRLPAQAPAAADENDPRSLLAWVVAPESAPEVNEE